MAGEVLPQEGIVDVPRQVKPLNVRLRGGPIAFGKGGLLLALLLLCFSLLALWSPFGSCLWPVLRVRLNLIIMNLIALALALGARFVLLIGLWLGFCLCFLLWFVLCLGLRLALRFALGFALRLSLAP